MNAIIMSTTVLGNTENTVHILSNCFSVTTPMMAIMADTSGGLDSS